MLLHQYVRSVQRVVIMGQDINRCSRDSSAMPQKEQADDIVFPIFFSRTPLTISYGEHFCWDKSTFLQTLILFVPRKTQHSSFKQSC